MNLSLMIGYVVRSGLDTWVLVLLLGACDRSQAPAMARADAGSDTGASGTATRLLDPGKEPRAIVSFSFAKGRSERRLLELSSRLSRGDTTVSDERVLVRLLVRYSAQGTVEFSVSSAETTAADVARIGSVAGMRIVQQFAPSGAAELPQIEFPPGADPYAADYVRGALVQVASNLLPLVPSEPVGDGARWAHVDLRYELIRRGEGEVIVERTSERHGPTQLDTGETVLVNEMQTYRVQAPLDGIARRVEALLIADQPGGTKRTTRLRFEVDE